MRALSSQSFVLHSSGTPEISKESLESKQKQAGREETPPPAGRPEICSPGWRYRTLAPSEILIGPELQK